MDVQRPIPNQKLRADWGRAVAEAVRSQGLGGPGVLRTPGGTSIAPAPLPGPARAEPPPEGFAAWFAAAEEGGALSVRVRKGAARGADGAELAYAATDFSDAGDWWEAPAPDGAAEIAAEADGDGGWTLRLLSGAEDGAAPAWRVPLAAVEAGEGVRRVVQLRTGDIQPPDGHWGDEEPLVEIPADGAGEWRALKEAGADERPSAVAESALVDIELDADGKVTAKRYRTRTVDSRGNVVAISERAEDADPDPGGAEDAPETPPCGHPLNLDDDHHPLGGGGGGDGAGEDDDDHPLNHEGPGGYTPNCAGQ